MLSYSLKCKKNTEREYPKVAKTKIGKIMLISKWYPENCPPVRVGVWVKVRVSFRVGVQPDKCPRGKLSPR